MSKATKKKKSETMKKNMEKKIKLSPLFGRIVGATEESRPAAIKKLWEYVKRKDLQNPADRRVIMCTKTPKHRVFFCTTKKTRCFSHPTPQTRFFYTKIKNNAISLSHLKTRKQTRLLPKNVKKRDFGNIAMSEKTEKNA